MKSKVTDEEYINNAEIKNVLFTFELNEYLNVDDLEENHSNCCDDYEYYLNNKIDKEKLIEILDNLKSDILKDLNPYFNKNNCGLFFNDFGFEVYKFETKSEYTKRIKEEKKWMK